MLGSIIIKLSMYTLINFRYLPPQFFTVVHSLSNGLILMFNVFFFKRFAVPKLKLS